MQNMQLGSKVQDHPYLKYNLNLKITTNNQMLSFSLPIYKYIYIYIEGFDYFSNFHEYKS